MSAVTVRCAVTSPGRVPDVDAKALRDGVVGEELSDGLLGDLLWVHACLLDEIVNDGAPRLLRGRGRRCGRGLTRIERLDPDWIHGMHGGSLRRESVPNFVRALRQKPFAYEGRVLGRELPIETEP
jgi:hypothetical protein